MSTADRRRPARHSKKKSVRRARPAPRDRRADILDAARAVLARSGFAGLTFEAVARELRVTKQAIIYWYPTKEALQRELGLEIISGEAEAMTAAVQVTGDAGAAISAFLHACVAHHVADLRSFRLLYVLPQLMADGRPLLTQADREAHVYPATARMYSALQAAILSDPHRNPAIDARALAVAVHCAAIGVSTMLGLMAASGDNLKQPNDVLLGALASALAQGVRREP